MDDFNDNKKSGRRKTKVGFPPIRLFRRTQSDAYFYALILIGLAGCGTKETALPENIKIYQIYEYDNNSGTETYTYHRNGLIDEITTDAFDPTSKQNKIDRIKYIYKYEDDVLYRTIQKNGTTIMKDD